MKKAKKAASPQSPSALAKASKNPAPYRLGKDEMNLVEYPFAVLRRSDGDKPIHLVFEKKHPRTGRIIKATWRVYGESALGMPGPFEERLYLVLMELSREQGFPERVMFSRADVLRRLGIAKKAKNYQMLHDAFVRLTLVTIDAQHSFWLTRAQDFAASVIFGIIEDVQMTEEKPGRRKGQIPLALSSFRWSEIMFSSLAAGNIRSINIQFALSLELQLSTRLFRYLDKHRTGDADNTRNKFEIELHKMCEYHLGMAHTPYKSKLKERLAPAIEELKARGFLTEVAFEPMKTQPGDEKAVFFFSNLPLSADSVALARTQTNPQSLIPVGMSPVELILAHDHAALNASAPDPVEVTLSVLLGDWKEVDAACERVRAGLGADEQKTIEEWALDNVPEFVRRNLCEAGAKATFERKRCARVWEQYGPQVRANLEEMARREVAARKPLAPVG